MSLAIHLLKPKRHLACWLTQIHLATSHEMRQSRNYSWGRELDNFCGVSPPSQTSNKGCTRPCQVTVYNIRNLDYMEDFMSALSHVTQLQSCHSGQAIHQLFQIHVSSKFHRLAILLSLSSNQSEMSFWKETKKISPLPLLTNSKIILKTPKPNWHSQRRKRQTVFRDAQHTDKRKQMQLAIREIPQQIERTVLHYKGGQTVEQPVHSGCGRLLRKPVMAPRIHNAFG